MKVDKRVAVGIIYAGILTSLIIMLIYIIYNAGVEVSKNDVLDVEDVVLIYSDASSIFKEPPIEVPEIESYEILPACSTTSTFKSYMDFRMINNMNSRQYALQVESYTGSDGLRYYEDRVIVAMAGMAVGTKIDLVFDDGDVLPVIIGDIKSGTDCAHPDGSILEFIVDTSVMNNEVKYAGNYDLIYNGPLKEMRKIV